MGLNKRTIYIAIFIVSVGGLAVVQYKYLQIGLNLAQVQFNRHIVEAGNLIKNDLSTTNQLTFLVGKALQRDSTYFKLGIDSVQEASRFFLNDFITERLVRSGIEAEFTYQLFSKDTNYYLQSPKAFRIDEEITTYPILLQGYLPDLLGDRIILELKFRDLSSYFLFQLNGLILPSLLFLIGIVFVIIWILRTYYWQRNLIFYTNEFINNLTHELKTPVFSIGLANKILTESATDAQKPVINIIRQQVHRLTGHIDRVLELAKIEAPRKVFDLRKVNFKPHMDRICKDFATLVALEDVVFTYELEEADCWIEAEVFHLENAINNLLDNAKKYADKPVIALKTRRTEKYFNIEITDNGRGISEQYLNRVFQKYYRVDQGDLHMVKGYGLGLSYAKKVVDGMKGKILIFSELDKGTKVMVQILLKND